jgi:plastocyanin
VGVPGQINISASGFEPAEVTVQSGHAVTFVNADTAPHRVVSVQQGVFDTGDIPPGGSASVTLGGTGFVDFRDIAQPTHTGTIRTLP